MPPLFAPPPRRLWPLLALAGALTLLLGLELRRGAASTATDRLFQSVLQPVTTPAPTATATRRVPLRGTPTATVRPLAPELVAAKRLLPLVIKNWPPPPTFTATATTTPTRTPTPIQYGWKGVGNAGIIHITPTVDGIWGIYPDWWYDWGRGGLVGGAAGATIASGPDLIAAMEAALEAGLRDPQYVPMIWCTDDVGAGPKPTVVAGLAQANPGRVWLIFNEPDLTSQCGSGINGKYQYHDDGNWQGLGRYLAEQYLRYYHAIKGADPTARVFPLGLTQLPMPDLAFPLNGTPSWDSWDRRAVKIWNGFTSYLATPAPAPTPTHGPPDGIAVHAYPGVVSAFHGSLASSNPCRSFASAGCVQEALSDAYEFFQGTPSANSAYNNRFPTYTAGKPIWITEIGSLTSATRAPAQPQATTVAGLLNPMLTWFQQHIGDTQPYKYINAVAWFSTHACGYYPPAATPPPRPTPTAGPTWTPTPTPTPGPSPTPQVEDYTASDLLSIGNLVCPITQQPVQHNLTVIGRAWATATCPGCQCPGPDCP